MRLGGSGTARASRPAAASASVNVWRVVKGEQATQRSGSMTKARPPRRRCARRPRSMAPRASASGTQFSTCAARRARESTRLAQGAASGTRHGAHDGSTLRRRREREKVKLLDARVRAAQVDGAHGEPRHRKQLSVDGTNLAAEASARAHVCAPRQPRASSRGSGGWPRAGRSAWRVSALNTNFAVRWRLVVSADAS